mgnify:FL=1
MFMSELQFLLSARNLPPMSSDEPSLERSLTLDHSSQSNKLQFSVTLGLSLLVPVTIQLMYVGPQRVGVLAVWQSKLPSPSV